MNDVIFNFFSEYIRKELGIVYNEVNRFGLEKRLEEIKEILQLDSVDHLLRYCKENGIRGHTKQLLLDSATNNETLFFRDKKVFKMIEKYLIPGFLESGKTSISARSLACSKGQEPYSLSIVAEEVQTSSPCTVSIDASDISSSVLDYAKKGVYSQLEVQRGLNTKLMIKYFKKDNQDYWHIDPKISSRVNFFERNLLELNQEKNKYDLILCRYVLIYQTVEKRIEIIKNIWDMLNENGVLILGGTESMIGLSDDFLAERYSDAVCYRKKGE